MNSTGTTLENEVGSEQSVPVKTSVTAVLACAWPALVLAGACLVPFLNKPFVVDDPEYLMIAQQILRAPLHPMDFTVCWNLPAVCAKQYLITPGNSLMGYVLVPTVLGGTHEWMAHATQLVLAWIAILAMASLVLRFGWDRWHATAGALLLVVIPPFLPMASTATPDVLATACALVAMERLAAWKAEQKWSQGAMAAMALGLAGFARPHLALLLPLGAFFLLESLETREIATQIRKRAWIWSPVIGGAALLMACILGVREHNLAIDPPSSVVSLRNVWINFPAYMIYLAFPMPLAACWLANRLKIGRWRMPVVVFAAAAMVALALWLANWDHPLVPLLAFMGCAALLSLLSQAWREHNQTDLFLLLWTLIPLPIVVYAHLPLKYLLPCMAAVILLCFRLMRDFSARTTRTVAVALIIASSGYSVLLLRSDAEYAEFNRNALHQLIAPHVAAGQTVWFPGQYFSYWYAPLDGAKLTYAGGPQPRPGDLLVVDVLGEGRDRPLARFPHRTLVESISHKYRWGRMAESGLGPYTNGYGGGFDNSGKDRFELWRIN